MKLLKTRKYQTCSQGWPLSICSHNSIVKHVCFSVLLHLSPLPILASSLASAPPSPTVPPFIHNLTSFLSIVQSFCEREVSNLTRSA
jgi:hypothetical protein